LPEGELVRGNDRASGAVPRVFPHAKKTAQRAVVFEREKEQIHA
jgi:hypothetical protein